MTSAYKKKLIEVALPLEAINAASLVGTAATSGLPCSSLRAAS